jgi:hypothetical protein
MFKATHKRRATTLSKTLLTAGLLGGAALSTLSASSAQAADGSARLDCSFGASIAHATRCDSGFVWRLEDKILKNFSFALGTPAGGPPSGDFAFIYSDNGPDGLDQLDTWQALAVFDPILPPPSTGSYKYDLEITPTAIAAGWVFETVELDVLHAGTGQKVTKTITGGIPDPLVLVSINGIPDPIFGSTPLSGTSITVMDEWELDGNTGNIAAIQNTFTQVPAPLPLLGAGAVLGSIRKLRKFSSQLKTFSMG